MHQVYDQKIEMKTKTTASTDFGNVTLELPSIHPGFCEFRLAFDRRGPESSD